MPHYAKAYHRAKIHHYYGDDQNDVDDHEDYDWDEESFGNGHHHFHGRDDNHFREVENDDLRDYFHDDHHALYHDRVHYDLGVLDEHVLIDHDHGHDD